MKYRKTTIKVLLINPPVLAVLEPWLDRPDFGRPALAYLAGFLRQYESFDIKIIDAKFQRLNFREVLQQALKWKPDVIGFTAFTNEIKPAAYQAALIKKELPHVITVIGGVHVTALPVQTLNEFPSFDIGVVGEGEVTFSDLCHAVLDQDGIAHIPGLVYRNNGEIIQTDARNRILDQNTIPFPAWDLLPPANTYFVQTIRGCPFNCSFCMNHNGRVARKRGVDNVIKELEWIINDFKPKRISFGDELFSVDMPRTHALLDAMIGQKIGERISWDVQTHVRFVDYELLKKFNEAKVSRVEMGVETGEEETLKTMGKGTTIEMIENAFSAAKKARVTTGSFFLFGQPNETVQSIKKTINFAAKLNPDLPMFGIMCPYPGTEVARMAARSEAGYKLLTTNWDEYNKQIGGALEFANLTRAQIELYQIIGYLKVFIKNRRFYDLAEFILEYGSMGWHVLKKLVLKRGYLAQMRKVPPDYEEMIYHIFKVSFDDLVTARAAWMITQKREMQRSRENKQSISKE